MLVRIQHCFDFRRIDVESRADDHFLGAADDIEIIAVKAREIAGIEPALAIDDPGRQIRRTIITAHDVAPADVKLTDFASRHRYAVDRPDAGFDPRKQRSDGLIGARRIESYAGYPW